MVSSKVRVAVFNTHPIQYYAPVWRRLAGYPELDVQVFYGSNFSIRGCRDKEFGVDIAWDVPLLDGYRSGFLQGFESVDGAGFWRPGPLPAIKAIFAGRPDVVVVTAYHSAFWYGIIAAAKAAGSRVVMRHDATDEAFGSRGFKRLLRGIILRTMYGSVSRFAVVGERARRHLKTYGAGDEKLGWSPFCVDTDWVEDQKRKWMPLRPGIRRDLGIEDNAIALLFCGKLIEQKDPMLIFEALRGLSEETRKSVHVVVAGSGPLADRMDSAGRAVLGGRFHALGFLNQGELGKAYAMSDILLLPSRSETWGLVVNEAMQFGLPAVLADGVGCHEDLVRDRSTGRVFHAGDREAMAEAMRSIIADFPEKREEYAKACMARVSQYSLEAASSGLKEAILSAAA